MQSILTQNSLALIPQKAGGLLDVSNSLPIDSVRTFVGGDRQGFGWTRSSRREGHLRVGLASWSAITLEPEPRPLSRAILRRGDWAARKPPQNL